jgi:hypothetical protein
MNLREANEKVKDHLNYMAVYDELMALLDKSLEGTLQIPTATEDEVVADIYVESVRDHILEIRESHAEQVAKIEKMEVKSGRANKGSGVSRTYVVGRIDRPRTD